jgi:RNA polymerase sigma factor (sigma-70 family)
MADLQMSEADLIVRAQAGDTAAYESLVREHQAAAFRLAYLLLGDAADAEEVAQDAFVAAFRSLGRFDVMRSFRPWLLTITANLARNRLRSLGRYWAAIRRLAAAGSSPAIAAESEATDRLARSDGHVLWEAVRRLPAADREIIYLRFFLSLPEAESAAILNVATGTVKSRQHRALARLRTVVQRDFPELGEGFNDGG